MARGWTALSEDRSPVDPSGPWWDPYWLDESDDGKQQRHMSAQPREPGSTAPSHRTWTAGQVDQYLAGLDRLFDSVTAAAGRSGPARTGADERVLLHGLLAVLEEDGVLVRDLRQRLIDFRATAPDGRTVLLCRIGTEARIEWWHDLDTGFPGRRSLADDPP